MSTLGSTVGEHPRLRHYPHHADYLGLEPEFRPFVMFTDCANYRSSAVNTDKYGLREQYDDLDEFISLESLRTKYQECNVLVGGSTVFGVDSTSDRTTMSHLLNREGVPCLNLGVRGATSQQELILFLLLKQYFPRVLNVVLFTGLNNCALAARPGTMIYPGFGGIFYEGMEPPRTRQEELKGAGRVRLTRLVDGLYERSRVFRRTLNVVLGNAHGTGVKSSRRKTFETKLAEVFGFVRNDLETWGGLQAAGVCKLHFVLQPVIGWTRRPLTRIEDECFQADSTLFPETRLFASASVYREYRELIVAACKQHEIDFHDGNEWLEDSRLARDEVFTDVCHLTDAGNRIMAEAMRTRLNWVQGAC